ncbi:DUF4340 domain-containing protein [Reichenbachiella ulvae]|uniref:DUF4340 domain-containing protein n=1 Tax=Reichenbachiella ulvae TaxID=2980104 RepID=A0ABT3CRY4_9BACT|nr:DUF4340 domain-containing protein [Reichenbachiella ulvae]MCV9386470.1 DUF4340 domain-containing protein [Reichenbachiella ulvae]
MKINNITLIGILVALVGVYFLVEYTGDKSRSDSMRSELVELNVEAVTGLEVEAPNSSVSVKKEGEDWSVSLPDGKTVPAVASSVENAINALNTIKPSRLASKKEEKWKDYQVDSAGTRVKVYQGDEVALDIILGRFAMEGQRSYSTFVRLAEDTEVYNVKDFMAFSVPSDASAYRDKSLAKVNKDSLAQVSVSYPADSSFVLTQADGRWLIEGQEADSAAVSKYLQSFRNVSSSKFYNEEVSGTPEAVLKLENNDGSIITIDAYWRDEKWIIHSSENETGWFEDEKLFERIFKGPSELRG